MKSLINSPIQIKHQQSQPEHLNKKLLELQAQNKQKEFMITKIQKEIAAMEAKEKEIDAQLIEQEEALNKLADNSSQEQIMEGEEQNQMNNWIEQVQKYNGVAQQVIDSLVTIEFEANESQICLSCYSQLKAGVQCTYLPCCHLFHKQCISDYLKVNKYCPACQEEVRL